jgi:hypothetical protein
LNVHPISLVVIAREEECLYLLGDLHDGLAPILDSQGVLTVTALIGGAEPDPDPGNNTASTAVTAALTQLVFDDDFEASPVARQWSSTTPYVSTTPAGARRFLGDFGAGTVCLNLDGLSQQAIAHVEFGLYLIRSWNGNQVNIPTIRTSFSNEVLARMPGCSRSMRPAC